jgi:hypothetical protein
MSSVPKIVEVPRQLDLSWTQEERGTFRGAAETWDLWHEWLKTNAPSPEQLYRKLLLDLFFQYRAVHHLGSDFDTNSPAYEEFNRCTGAPVESIDDYVSRIVALLDYLLDLRVPAQADH